MGAEALVKKTYRRVRDRYCEERRRCIYRKAIADYIKKTTDVVIPELAEEKKREAEEYWLAHGITLSSTEWHRYYYAKTGLEDPRFVPDDVFHRVIRPKLNDLQFASVWSDKAYTDRMLRGVKTVRSVVRCVNGRLLNEQFELIDQKTADAIMNEYEALVLKPTLFTHTGENVQLAHAPFRIAEIAARYGRYFTVQIPVKQHPGMALLNESSVNTVRISTVLFDTQAHALHAFVKAGQPGDFTDNGGGAHRVFIGIENGRFRDFALDNNFNRMLTIPSGFAFAGQKVPYFEEMCRTVEKAHAAVPHFGLAFWDVCVDVDSEPTIVEMNLRFPVTYVPQVCCGPFFGPYTDEILEYIAR